MKKVIAVFAAIVLFAGVSFAQNNPQDTTKHNRKDTAKKVATTQQTTTTQQSGK